MNDDTADWKQRLGDTFEVHVTQTASVNRVKAEISGEGQISLKLYVTSVPEDGKANEAVIKLLSQELKVPKSAITIIQGLKSRKKVVRIER